MSKYVDFGLAVRALKEGKRVRCEDWPDSKEFIFVQVPSIIKEEIVPKMQSLPQSTKDYFKRTFESGLEQISEIYYSNQIALVSESNKIESYSPTCADVLSDWWLILD